jgi:mannose-1-phosphate guanylyltransferase
VLERELLNSMAPAGTNTSIERDVFPALVGDGLFGYAASGYWLDIGTPQRYLQGTYDILEGNVRTDLGERLAQAGLVIVDTSATKGRVAPPAVVGSGCVVEEGAIVGGRTVLGHDVEVGEGTHVESSVLLDGATVGAHSAIRSSIVGPGVVIGEHCHLDGVVLGEGVSIGSRNALAHGARIFPGVQLPEGAIRF